MTAAAATRTSERVRDPAKVAAISQTKELVLGQQTPPQRTTTCPMSSTHTNKTATLS